MAHPIPQKPKEGEKIKPMPLKEFIKLQTEWREQRDHLHGHHSMHGPKPKSGEE